MLKQCFWLVFFLLFLSGFALGQTVARDIIERNARNRYRPPAVLEQVPADDVYNQTPFTGNRAMLNGYGRKTAGELGLAGREVWNEYPVRCNLAAGEGSRAVKVVLDARAEIFYDTASMEPLYIDGCVCGGKPWVNRIKLVIPPQPAPPPPPPVQILPPLPPSEPTPFDLCPKLDGIQTEIPAGMVRDEFGNCFIPKQPELPPPPAPPPPPTPPLSPPPPQIPPPRTIIIQCSETSIESYASWQSRWLGAFMPRNLWETGVSVGGGAGGAYGLSTKQIRDKQAGQSAAVSLAAKIAVELANPDKDRVRLTVAGKNVGTFKKGEDKLLPGQIGRIAWKGSQARVYLMLEGKEALCGTGSTVNNINLTPVPIIKLIREIAVPVDVPAAPAVKGPGVLVPRP